MTRRGKSDDPCCVPGCLNLSFTDPRGRHYKKCRQHLKEAYSKAGHERHMAKRAAQQETGQSVEILVVDWKDDRLLRVTGTVTCVEAMPATHGDLMRLMAQLAKACVYVAKPHAYKEEDV